MQRSNLPVQALAFILTTSNPLEIIKTNSKAKRSLKVLNRFSCSPQGTSKMGRWLNFRIIHSNKVLKENHFRNKMCQTRLNKQVWWLLKARHLCPWRRFNKMGPIKEQITLFSNSKNANEKSSHPIQGHWSATSISKVPHLSLPERRQALWSHKFLWVICIMATWSHINLQTKRVSLRSPQ